MSRTRKDRPYWVTLNDPKTADRVEDHDHTKFGKEVTRTRYVKDEKGEQVYEIIKFPDDGWVTKLNAAGIYVYVFGELNWKRAVRETVVVGHMAEHCTIEVPEARAHDSRDLLPCGFRIRWGYWKVSNRPRKKDRKAYHATYKTLERDALVNSRNRYNAGYDLDDWDEHEVYSTRTTNHRDWWD
jgi:hypothetical protein